MVGGLEARAREFCIERINRYCLVLLKGSMMVRKDWVFDFVEARSKCPLQVRFRQGNLRRPRALFTMIGKTSRNSPLKPPRRTFTATP
jgi:hypothetical protein